MARWVCGMVGKDGIKERRMGQVLKEMGKKKLKPVCFVFARAVPQNCAQRLPSPSLPLEFRSCFCPPSLASALRPIQCLTILDVFNRSALGYSKWYVLYTGHSHSFVQVYSVAHESLMILFGITGAMSSLFLLLEVSELLHDPDRISSKE